MDDQKINTQNFSHEAKTFLKRNWMIIAAILYIISPIDIIPDFVPVFGQSDDLVVLILTLIIRMLEHRKETRHKKISQKGPILEGELVEESESKK